MSLSGGSFGFTRDVAENLESLCAAQLSVWVCGMVQVEDPACGGAQNFVPAHRSGLWHTGVILSVTLCNKRAISLRNTEEPQRAMEKKTKELF